MNSSPAPFDSRVYVTPHFGVLLLVLLILLVVAPLVPPGRAGYAVEFFFDFVLVVGAYSTAWQSKHRIPFIALTVITLVVRWTDIVTDHTAFSVSSSALVASWLIYTIYLVVAALFRIKQPSMNAIMGAIVAYLLAAVAFSSLFEIIEMYQPGSFSGIPDGNVLRELENAFLYFSLVSITTMGYGDIVPVSELARSFATLEGAFGTLYLAVMIARLVGLHAASHPDD